MNNRPKSANVFANIKKMHLCALLFVWLQIAPNLPRVFAANDTIDTTNRGWTWDKILRSRQPIVANGNVWPPPAEESAEDCLILLTHNQIMWHCPSGDNDNYKRAVLFRKVNSRFRGAFMAPGSENRRMWVLNSDPKQDMLLELDTITEEILQSLIIEGSFDGHDAVVVGNSAFIADTRHGHVIEVEVPASTQPYFESSIANGARETEREGYATIIKRHVGFTRADHINNVAIHPDVLLSNLHGKGAINPRITNQTISPSPTRLSALLRKIPEGEGRELNVEDDGFNAVVNVGTWCHGIAFWENMSWDSTDPPESQIKLISLDSKSGSLVSVVLSGPNIGDREILWEPDLSHPVLVPPDGITKAYFNGAKVFSKGLAVQNGVAYFGVSYARAPALRHTVPESLLVAVDIKSKTEIWSRTVRSNGLINQILIKSYLGNVALPAELSTIELTHHGVGGRLVDTCTDLDLPQGAPKDTCKVIETMMQNDQKVWVDKCKESENALACCCICKGGQSKKLPLMAGKLDKEILNLEENVTATATFLPHDECRNSHGMTKHLALAVKDVQSIDNIKNIDHSLHLVVKHLCTLDVRPLREMILNVGDEGFTHRYQHKKGNAILSQGQAQDKFKPDVSTIFLIFSSKDARVVYHFPWLDDWLPKIQECILDPLGVPLNKVLRMQIANMPKGSNILFHIDANTWSRRSHRVHVPIVTHANVFFMAETKHRNSEENQILRIKANPGEVFEFNNKMGHAVRNLGPSRSHIIIDWVEDPLYGESESSASKSRLVRLLPGDSCNHPKGLNGLECHFRKEL